MGPWEVPLHQGSSGRGGKESLGSLGATVGVLAISLQASVRVCRRRYTHTVHLALLYYVFAFHPLANISVPYPSFPLHSDFQCRLPAPQLLFSYYSSAPGHFCPRPSSLMPVKPGSTPYPPPSAVKSHPSPCRLLSLPPCVLPGSHWAPAACAGRWDLLPIRQ